MAVAHHPEKGIATHTAELEGPQVLQTPQYQTPGSHRSEDPNQTSSKAGDVRMDVTEKELLGEKSQKAGVLRLLDPLKRQVC